jgi:hypothetical protein
MSVRNKRESEENKMGLNFRKSVKVADGVKLNVGKKSAGVSVGGKYVGASFNTKSGARVRASLPGTGLSYTKSLSSIGKKSSSKKKSKSSAKSALSTVLTIVIVLIAAVFIIRKNWTAISETLGLDQSAVGTLVTGTVSGTSSADSTAADTDDASAAVSASDAADTDGGTDAAVSYVINTSTKKVHVSTCRYADTTSKNIEKTSETLDSLLADGYSECGTCLK